MTIRPTIDDVNVSLVMVIHQHPHRSSGDLGTGECILLRKEDGTKTSSLYSFSNSQPMSVQYTHVYRLFQLEMIFQCVFDHAWYVLLSERDDTIFVYRARFM